MHRHKKRLLTLLIILLAVVAAVCLVRHICRVDLERRLLKNVDISPSIHYQSRGYTHQTDPLMYVSGYDILVAHIASEDWQPPASWHPEMKTLEAIESEQDIALVYGWFNGKGIELPEIYDAWYFFETGRGGDEYRDWRFYLGLHSPDGVLIVYHGHDLWSLDDSDRFDAAQEERRKTIP